MDEPTFEVTVTTEHQAGNVRESHWSTRATFVGGTTATTGDLEAMLRRLYPNDQVTLIAKRLPDTAVSEDDPF